MSTSSLRRLLLPTLATATLLGGLLAGLLGQISPVLAQTPPTAPDIVTLQSPSDGSSSVGTTPTLAWSQPNGAVTGTTTYIASLWDPFSGSGGTRLADLAATTSLSTAVPTGEGLLNGHTYFWAVSACNGSACSAYASHWFSFTTSATPNAAQQSSPANGATGVSTTPTLAWSASANAIAGTTVYSVSLWDPYGGPAGHLLATLTTTAPTTSIAVPPSETLLYSQSYSWNVNACNGTSCSGYNSQWFSFTTSPQPIATASSAITTEVTNPDFSDAATGSTSIPGWSGSFASVQHDSSGVSYVHNVSSLTSENLALDFPTQFPSGGSSYGGTLFRIVTHRNGGGLTIAYNGHSITGIASGTDASGVWMETEFIVGSGAGSGGALVLSGTGSGSTQPDVALVQRLDGTPGRAGTAAGLMTGNAGLAAGDLSLNSLSGLLSLGRVYSSQGVGTRMGPSGALATGPFGPKWQANWQYALLLDGVSDPSNGSVTLLEPGGGTVTFSLVSGSYVAPASVHATLTNSGTTYTLKTPNQQTWTFAPAFTGGPAVLKSVADRNSNTLTLAYDSSGNLTTLTDSNGRSIALSISGGKAASASDSASRSVSYGYSGGTLHTVQDVRGKTTTYAMSNGFLSSVTDPNGHAVLNNTYDSTSRLATAYDAYSNTVTYNYATPAGGVTELSDPNHNTHDYYLDAGLRATDSMDGNSNDTAATYDAANNLAGTSAPLNVQTAMTYDTSGNLLTAVDGENFTTTATYTSKNDPLTVQDALGHTTIASYDSSGNLHTLQNAASQTTTYTVNSHGQVTAAQDPRSYSSGATYNSSTGDIATTSDPYSHGMTYTTDSVGRVLTAQDANSHTTTNTYDAAGHVLTSTDATSKTTTSTYDDDGHLKTVQDANAHTTTYGYDNDGRLLTVTDPLAHTTTYGYDAAGNRTSVQDANGKTTSYTFDNNNRPLTEVDPRSDTLMTLTYDAAGHLATRRDALGNQATFSYSPRNQLTGISYSSGSGTPGVTYGYDAAGNRTSMSDGTGTSSYTYDAANRLTSTSSPQGTVGYGYDADGNQTSVSYPGGTRQVTYGYDNADRLTSVTDWNSHATSYGYDNAGRLTSTTLPSSTGVSGAYTYDNANHLLSVTWSKGGSTLYSATYTVDNAGNRATKAIAGSAAPTTGTETYTLDAVNRLTNVAYPGSVSVAYTYDNVGNRQTQVVTGGATPGTTTYGYDATDPNVLTSVTPPGASAISYSVDNQGNTTARGSDSFGWNGENELTSGTVGGASFAAQYNGDGLRANRTVGSTTTSFVWGNGNVLDDGTQYVYGAELVEHVASGSTYYVLADGSGSTVALVDSTGAVQQKYGYDAYGNVTATSGSQPTEFQYDGQQTDPSGLQYLRARYYDAATGRFLSRDPSPGCVFNPATHNPYTFAGNNPATNSDPSGQTIVYIDGLPYDQEGTQLNHLPIGPTNDPFAPYGSHQTAAQANEAQLLIEQGVPSNTANIAAANAGSGQVDPTQYLGACPTGSVAFVLISHVKGDIVTLDSAINIYSIDPTTGNVLTSEEDTHDVFSCETDTPCTAVLVFNFPLSSVFYQFDGARLTYYLPGTAASLTCLPYATDPLSY